MCPQKFFRTLILFRPRLSVSPALRSQAPNQLLPTVLRRWKGQRSSQDSEESTLLVDGGGLYRPSSQQLVRQLGVGLVCFQKKRNGRGVQ